MFREIIQFLASLFIFGIVYWVLAIIVTFLQLIFPITDDIVLAVFFLWTMVPAIYYIGLTRRFIEGSKKKKLTERRLYE